MGWHRHMEDEKQCYNHCPNCGAGMDDIDWGLTTGDDTGTYQYATCKKCGCDFEEEYTYRATTWNKSDMEEDDLPDE